MKEILLKKLGKRIAIIGFSSSGKSTLADRLGKKMNLPVYHLDDLAHYPNTAWQRRPDQEFLDMHHKLIKEQSEWIIEGNYRIALLERLKNATTIIWVDSNRFLALFRYIKRSLKNDTTRIGRLEGASHEFAFYMIKHLLFTWPRYRSLYKKMLQDSGKPIIHINSMKELENYCNQWELTTKT